MNMYRILGVVLFIICFLDAKYDPDIYTSLWAIQGSMWIIVSYIVQYNKKP